MEAGGEEAIQSKKMDAEKAVSIEVEAEGGQGVDEFDLKALVDGDDGAGQTGWTCAYYEEICWVAAIRIKNGVRTLIYSYH